MIISAIKMIDTYTLIAGTDLPEIKKVITQQIINRYAEASRDFNPIHIDPAFAARTPLRGTIAHGMLSLAYISQLMTEVFGQHWVNSGKVSVRFKNPAHPGDTISIKGRITTVKKTDEYTEISCEISCTNQHNEPVVSGETSVRLSK